MQAVILAGGAGTRLKPLTDNVPKPMIEVNGRPFLSYLVDELKRSGIIDLVFCVGHLADKFREYFGDGSKFGINISYSIEKEFLGTAGALKLAEEYLEDDFFVLNGDTYLPVDYADVHARFRQAGKMGLIVAYDNSEKIAEENIALNADGLVVAYGKKEPLKKGDKLIELKAEARDDYRFIDAGAYVFKKELLGLIAQDRFVSLEGEIYPELIKSGELAAFVTSRRYFDLGTPERLELIRRELR